MNLFAELKRRNVVRAAVLYIGAAWAMSQGVAQLLPVFDFPNWVVRWFVIAALIGFPFAMLFSWFYEWTPHGIQRESDVEQDASLTRATGKKMDRWIIAVLGLSVVLLLANTFVLHKDLHYTDANASAMPSNTDSPATQRIPDMSIAILPLANESGDKDKQYFSDGLSENLITALSQFSGLKVIGRHSAFLFRDSKDDAKTIGAKLGVATLLEGSVRHAGNVVRINAELIKAADGSTLWSEHYDRPYKDLFKLQDDITHAVADALRARLLGSSDDATQSDRPPGGNLDAYTAYLQGRFHDARNTEADDREAIDFYRTAIRLDPGYAQAYAELSRTLTGVAAQYLDGQAARQVYMEAREAANTGLTLSPNLAAAHSASGYLLSNADFDWHGAEAQYRRALELAPNAAAAKFLLGDLEATLGRTERAIELTHEALATDPLYASRYNVLASYLSAVGRLDEAASAARRAIELRPGALGYYEQLAIIEIQRGDATAALAAARQELPGVWQDIALALARQIGDDPIAADAALQTLLEKQADLATYQIAEVYALRNDADNTFAWLGRAWNKRDPGVGYLLYDPFILRYKDDPRFAAFCKTVGLPEPGAMAAANDSPNTIGPKPSTTASAPGHD